MAMQKKIVRRSVQLVNNESKEMEMESCSVLKAAEKRNCELREELSLSTERIKGMNTRIEETNAVFDKAASLMRERLLSALDNQGILHSDGGFGEILIGELEIIPCESSFVVGTEEIRKVSDVVRHVNRNIREKGEQTMRYEDKKKEMEDRLSLIKKRHQAMLMDLESFDEEENEAFIACLKEDTDEGLAPLEEEYLNDLFGINKEVEHDLPAKKEGRFIFKTKEVEDEDLKWVMNHRNINRGVCKNHPDVEKDFIESLRDNRELAISWFPELDLLEWEEARKFLRSCLGEDWSEQHADRAVHFYKCGLDA